MKKRTLRDQIRVRLKADDPVQSVYNLIYTERMKAVDDSFGIKIYRRRTDTQRLNEAVGFVIDPQPVRQLTRLLRHERRRAINEFLGDEANPADWHKVDNAIGLCCFVPSRVRYSLICLIRKERAKTRKKVRREIGKKYTFIKKIDIKKEPGRVLEI